VAVLPKPMQVILVFFPGGVAGVGIKDQHVPLIARDVANSTATIGPFAGLGLAKGVRAGIGWVVQNPQYRAYRYRHPSEFASVGAQIHSVREEHAFLMKGPHC